ncbi:ferritin-like domain-containing protein [Flavobacterium suzhouense]|uniref:Ferritin-like domain-containing protein n=1 Tax=Flavobacterium suzhouense TaxID=1529638 RepID=A0ABW5NVB3_9FLAO
MNIIKFIESFTTEGMINDLNAKGSRRDSFTQLQKMGSVAAMAAIPFGLSAFFAPTKAKAATTFFGPTETPTEALQLALILEYLEDEFYAMALDSGIVPSADQAIIAQIAKHENAHVNFLKSALADAAPEKPTFDFTAGGNFDPFNDYPTLLALAQAFEDTGVRAYKGQAGNLISNGDLLTAALQIHSVEAMHASQIRRLRGQKGWIIGSDRGGLPDAAQAIYTGEENVMQAGFDTSMVGNFGSGSASESFDEPMTGAVATNIASLFIV